MPDEEWDADPDVLVCKNGALRISTRGLGLHHREHYATSAVPYKYDAGAVPAIWQFFLRSTVPTAASFLQEFAGEGPWAHLDIAGTAYLDRTRDYYGRVGATGYGVRLLAELARRLCR